MRVLVYNDTSDYHYGCKEVMQYLYDDIRACGHELSDSFSQSDAIVVNGEGTMHHRQNRAVVILDVMGRALRMNKKVALINTVFQDMSLTDAEVEVLKKSYVSVREVKSQQYLASYGIEADIHLDLSYWRGVPSERLPSKDIVAGEMFFRPPYKSSHDFTRVNIFENDWTKTIDDIALGSMFITGRHHEVYAACIAERPFIALRGNTWKIEGLIETAGVNINTLDGLATDDEIDVEIQNGCPADEFAKLFAWMKNQKRFTLKDVL